MPSSKSRSRLNQFRSCAGISRLRLVGINGTISYMLAQRTQEIGVRTALGAPPSSLRYLLLAQVVVLVGLRPSPSAVLAALARLMTSLLCGVSALRSTYLLASCLSSECCQASSRSSAVTSVAS